MLHYFVSGKPEPIEPVARALRRVAFPVEPQLPQPLRRLVQRIAR